MTKKVYFSCSTQKGIPFGVPFVFQNSTTVVPLQVALIVNKKVWNAILGCTFNNDRLISAHFQGKQFNFSVIQVYAPTSNAEEAEVERVYEDLQELLEITPKKRCPFH